MPKSENKKKLYTKTCNVDSKLKCRYYGQPYSVEACDVCIKIMWAKALTKAYKNGTINKFIKNVNRKFF